MWHKLFHRTVKPYGAGCWRCDQIRLRQAFAEAAQAPGGFDTLNQILKEWNTNP